MKRSIAAKSVFALEAVLNIFVLFVSIMMLLYGLYSIWDANMIVSNSLPKEYEEYSPSDKDRASFKQLRKENPEIIGWIDIYGTGIDYPLLQHNDNKKYLTTNPRGDYSLTGSIFLDYRNSPNFDDFNTIIYGHHMSYHTMFGDISEFKNKKFFSKHKYGRIFYDGKYHGLYIYMFGEIDAYTNDVYRPGIKGVQNWKEYLVKLRDNASYIRNAKVDENSQIVILSTCTDDVTNGRHILVAKITDKLYKDKFSKNKSIKNIDSYMLANRDILSIWVIVLLLLLFIKIIAGKSIFKGRTN